jgi:very-short-patch-repair endonuclease
MYTREYEFDEGRRWRSDFCWPALKVCVEVEGADHRRYDRFKGDIQKYEALRAAGWELMRVTMGEMERDPDKWFGALKSALARRHRSDG